MVNLVVPHMVPFLQVLEWILTGHHPDTQKVKLENDVTLTSILSIHYAQSFLYYFFVLFISGDLGENFQILSDNVSSNIFQINNNSEYPITGYLINTFKCLSCAIVF